MSSRRPASKDHFLIRRLHPSPNCWREGFPTSLAFAGTQPKPDELSIDIHPKFDDDEKNLISERQKAHLQIGFGLGVSVAELVREKLLEKQISGDVLHDPVTENDLHGIITGKDNDKKKKSLKAVFDIHVAPDAEKYFAYQEKKRKEENTDET